MEEFKTFVQVMKKFNESWAPQALNLVDFLCIEWNTIFLTAQKPETNSFIPDTGKGANGIILYSSCNLGPRIAGSIF